VKPDALRAELAVLRAASSLGVPVVAIGGIDAGNAGDLFAAGADAVAVISAVFATGDVADATEALMKVARRHGRG
jgi:thiamine-phosphate pyrophosphorylase